MNIVYFSESGGSLTYYHRPKDRTITPLRTLLAALWQR